MTETQFLAMADRDKMAKGRHNYRAHRGTDNGTAKLTDDDVRLMRAIYANGKTSQPELARRFGLRQSTVWAILHRRLWNHVK